MENFTQELIFNQNQWLDESFNRNQAKITKGEFPQTLPAPELIHTFKPLQKSLNPTAVLQITRHTIGLGIFWFLLIGLITLMIGFSAENPLIIAIFGMDAIPILIISLFLVAGTLYGAFLIARIIYIKKMKGYILLSGIMLILILILGKPIEGAIQKTDSILLLFILAFLFFLPAKAINFASKMATIQKGFGKNTHGRLIEIVLILKVIGHLILLEGILLIALHFI